MSLASARVLAATSLLALSSPGCGGASPPPSAPSPAAATVAPEPPASAASAGPLCGTYVANRSGSFDAIVFGDGGKVIVKNGCVDVERAYRLHGPGIRIDGGLELRRETSDVLALVDTNAGDVRFVRTGPAPVCKTSPSQIGPTCFDAAEDQRQAGLVGDAQESYRTCCKSGNMDACGAYGALVFLRTGSGQDARASLTLACDAGRGAACATIAAIEETGDSAARRKFLERACLLKHVESCAALATE